MNDKMITRLALVNVSDALMTNLSVSLLIGVGI